MNDRENVMTSLDPERTASHFVRIPHLSENAPGFAAT